MILIWCKDTVHTGQTMTTLHFHLKNKNKLVVLVLSELSPHNLWQTKYPTKLIIN